MADGASFKKIARLTRGSPTHEVTNMASQLCKLFLRQKLVTVSSFRNVYLPVRRLQILWSPNEGLKKSFPAVLNKSDSHNHRSRDRVERNWRRPFTYFAVLGVVNATENKQKSAKGNSHICTPSEQDNPPYRFNVRSSNGRFNLRRARKKIYASSTTARS